jgi:hypothetical protein
VIKLFLDSARGRIGQIEQHIGEPAQLVVHANALKSMSPILGASAS